MRNKPIWSGEVFERWVDYNGHMNDAAYAEAFSISLDALIDSIGLDEVGRNQENYTIFTLEAHIKYLAEAQKGQTLYVFVHLLDLDQKRMHLWFEMKNNNGDTISTSEQMVMGMDQISGRPAPFPNTVEKAIASIPIIPKEAWPVSANKQMGIRKK
ncbi:thioesterase family protein [Shouchella patagoniensis]|uniref:thioesterase family protein n=1 Tax=Shouchella patagoniensis TaxID=228576 RepID=UPI00099544C0|nr:thioesterase family protein [Shouchella patagoniensis]